MQWTRAAILWATCASVLTSAVSQHEQWPIHDSGLNQVVQWDHYSFIVNGQRMFSWGGEMHLFRIPVPELWIDFLQKVKAAGFNTVAYYENWGWHAPNKKTLDFSTGAHDFARAFEFAKELGLYVVYRPGPYSNAELNGGGLPGWLLTGDYGLLRDDDPRYAAEWSRYLETVVEYVRPHLITNGGPIVLWQLENEYMWQWKNFDNINPNMTSINYMMQLNNYTRGWDVDVPFMANNPILGLKLWSKDYSNYGGEVDVYSLDHYPACFSCDMEECVGYAEEGQTYKVADYYTHFQETAPTNPSFLAEFQGGAYNPWHGPEGGCINETGPDWVNMFYRHNLAEKVTAVSLYMLCGGTNWGHMSTSRVATSYDFSSAISENRMLPDKYYETKLFGLFVRVAREFTKVNLIGNSTDYTTNSEITASELRNPDTNGAFYITRHNNSMSTEFSQFRLHVSTSIGNLTIPQIGSIALDGTMSKALVTDFSIGSSGKSIIYATTDILTVSDLQERQVVVFWAPSGETGELLIKGASRGKVVCGSSTTTFTPSHHGVIASFTVSPGITVVDFDNGVQAVITDRKTAYGFWAPTLNNDPLAWENATVLVHGPYLVRGVSIDDDTIDVLADWADETRLEIWASKEIRRVTINGASLCVKRTPYGSLVGVLSAIPVTTETVQAELPPLTDWKVADGLPEVAADYDDSRWIVADHTTTPSAQPPETFDPVLYADQYGYSVGGIIWRARFDGSGGDPPSSVHLRGVGGEGNGFSLYLNGEFLGAWLGNMTHKDGNLTLSFENVTVRSDAENVLTVVQDPMGHAQLFGIHDPRGIANATLITTSGEVAKFSSWKIQGNAGGHYIVDHVRGTYNEGGLHGERLGWHLPGFDDSSWESGLPSEGSDGSRALFYRTVVPLDLPKGYDVKLAFELKTQKRAKLRAQLFVNGYQFGRSNPYFGNQVVFPVFPGILDYHGDNTIALQVWGQTEEGGSVDIQWKVLGVHQSSLDLEFDSTYLRPGWTDRSQYA